LTEYVSRTFQVQRFTTLYDEAEDRISLTAFVHTEQSIRFWLTRRLTDRLIPHLTSWLEKFANSMNAKAVLEFQQAEAGRSLKPEPPVINTSERNVLVYSVDISSNDAWLKLVLKIDEESFYIEFSRDSLQQWLAIIMKTYHLADWGTESWPRWYQDSGFERRAKSNLIH